MSDPGAIEAATRRLMQALDALEAAVDRRLEAARDEATLAEQVHTLGSDRSRLAAELDTMAARARTLENANHDVAGRIDAAIDTIRAVIAAQEQ